MMKDNSRLNESMKDERFVREVNESMKMIKDETIEESLKRIGYLKESETLPILQDEDSLPDDTRTLILLYLNSPLLDIRDSIQIEKKIERIREKYGLIGVLKDEPENVTLRDKIGDDNMRASYREIQDVYTTDKIKRVENFVKVGRERIRTSLLKSIKMQLADYLLDGQDCGIIFDYVVSRGYKPQGSELDEEDRTAFEKTSEIILNSIEKLLLTRNIEDEFKSYIDKDEEDSSCETFEDELINYFHLSIFEANQMIGETLGGDGGSDEIKAIRKQCKEKIEDLKKSLKSLNIDRNVLKSKFKDLVK